MSKSCVAQQKAWVPNEQGNCSFIHDMNSRFTEHNVQHFTISNEAARLSAQPVGVLSALDLQSNPRFESRSDNYLDLFLGSPGFKSSATHVNSQLVCLPPDGIILNNVMFNLNYLFQLFAWPHRHLCYKHCRGQMKVILLFLYLCEDVVQNRLMRPVT